MTGTQSLSFMQLQAIQYEVHRLEIIARRLRRWVELKDGSGQYVGAVVTVVIHQADKAYVDRPLANPPGRKYENVPSFTRGADKKIQLHRCYADSETFWLTRDGDIIRRPVPVTS